MPLQIHPAKRLTSPLNTQFLGKTLSGPFTIPSGIVTCSAPIIQAFFDSIPEVGVLTTKSIGPGPGAGYRGPVLGQYSGSSPYNCPRSKLIFEQGCAALAKRMAEKTLRRSKPVTLESMPAQDRRVIHMTLRDDAKVRTESVGEGNKRRVRIYPV